MSAPIDYVEVEIAVAADVAKVWSFISDINVPAQFSREFKGAEWLDTPGLAARFVVTTPLGISNGPPRRSSPTSPKMNHLHGRSVRWMSRSQCGALRSPAATAMCC